MLASICVIRQFVKCLFQSVNLFFYACKTLKPGLFWYAVEREPVRLESTNPKKNSQTWDALWWGAKPSTKKKIYINFFFWWRLWPPIKEHPGSGNFFLGLVDSSRNRLVSTAYQNYYLLYLNSLKFFNGPIIRLIIR